MSPEQAEQLEATLAIIDDSETDAYDGSDADPRRDLTARERDILCRLLSATIAGQRPMLTNYDIARLSLIHHIIDPRREE
jgi:hypothetical protein